MRTYPASLCLVLRYLLLLRGGLLGTTVAQIPDAVRVEFHAYNLTVVALTAEHSLTLRLLLFNSLLLLLFDNCVPLLAILVLVSATITLHFTPVAIINRRHLSLSVCLLSYKS